MKLFALTSALALIGTAALAETPNRTTMSFEEFVGASGCVIRDNAAGQSNLYSVDGGACPAEVQVAYTDNNGPDDTNGSTVPGL